VDYFKGYFAVHPKINSLADDARANLSDQDYKAALARGEAQGVLDIGQKLIDFLSG